MIGLRQGLIGFEHNVFHPGNQRFEDAEKFCSILRYISALNSTPAFLVTTCSLNCTCDGDRQSPLFFWPKEVQFDLRASVKCIQVLFTLLQPFTIYICHHWYWVCRYAEHVLISYAGL